MAKSKKVLTDKERMQLTKQLEKANAINTAMDGDFPFMEEEIQSLQETADLKNCCKVGGIDCKPYVTAVKTLAKEWDRLSNLAAKTAATAEKEFAKIRKQLGDE